MVRKEPADLRGRQRSRPHSHSLPPSAGLLGGRRRLRSRRRSVASSRSHPATQAKGRPCAAWLAVSSNRAVPSPKNSGQRSNARLKRAVSRPRFRSHRQAAHPLGPSSVRAPLHPLFGTSNRRPDWPHNKRKRGFADSDRDPKRWPIADGTSADPTERQEGGRRPAQAREGQRRSYHGL